MRTVRGLLSVAAVVIGGALAGFLGYQLWERHPGPGGELQVAPAPQGAASDVVPGALLPGAPIAAPGAPPVIPAELPDIALPDLDGHTRALRSFLGHPLIINFWATWCSPCRREIPMLQQLQQRHRSQGLEVIGIALDFKQAVRDYVVRNSVSFQQLIGEDQGEKAAQKFGMQPVLPFSIFVQPDGRILAVRVGELHEADAEYLLQTLQSVAAGAITTDDARIQIAEHSRNSAVERARAPRSDSGGS
jgi:thiol-disulfide isomerase/thioredoxin